MHGVGGKADPIMGRLGIGRTSALHTKSSPVPQGWSSGRYQKAPLCMLTPPRPICVRTRPVRFWFICATTAEPPLVPSLPEKSEKDFFADATAGIQNHRVPECRIQDLPECKAVSPFPSVLADSSSRQPPPPIISGPAYKVGVEPLA